MKHSIWLVIPIAIFAASILSAQSSTPPNALPILQQVSKRYADAKSYHIEATEERTNSNELEHSWHKTILSAAETPGNRYLFGARSSTGSFLFVSDGKTEWVYEVEAHSYTQKSMSPEGPSKLEEAMPFNWGTHQSQELRNSLAGLAKRYKSATQLPDEIVLVEGHQITTSVVRVSTTDLKRRAPSETTFEETYWIDKTNMTIVKEVDHEHTYTAYDGVTHIPIYEETATIYPVTDLDLQHPDPSLFSFTPPQDAKLVDKFPDPFKYTNLTGNAAPSLTLKTPDGKQVSLDSFRGKPLLIDFWATWCKPCVKSMPELANLYQQTKDKGLVLLTIDKDEDAKDATDFLAKNHYAWANFHDEGDASKAFGEHFGIPRTVLIDVNGKIVYDRSGENDDQLLAAVAKLGPDYAFLVPKLQPNPCVASK